MAHTAYHVDRLGTLQEGQIIELERYDDVRPKVLQAHVDSRFAEGVTKHGERYMLQPPGPEMLFDPWIESTCELSRRAEFPRLPSRFQSVFGCATLDEARAFLAKFGAEPTDAQILEVETDSKPFRADMHCLDIRGSILVSAYGARRYWRQEPNNLEVFPDSAPLPPFWELLLRPPVRVIRKVSRGEATSALHETSADQVAPISPHQAR